MSIHNRIHPYITRIKERYLLTGKHSTKKTYHIVLDLSQGELPFTVGDSLAVMPENDPRIVESILQQAGYTGKERIIYPKTQEFGTLRTFLQTKANLSKIHPQLVSLLDTQGAPFSSILEKPETLRPFLASHSVLDLLRKTAKKATYSAQEFAERLMPLIPRFYSIASSSKVFPNEIHLTVAFLSYKVDEEERYGVASYFLCEQAQVESTPIAVYIQPSNHFSLPDPDASMILIGPGTGIAPFRAFLQERLAQQAQGRSWLFFGERHRATDFYYESFFLELVNKHLLRLDTAFSRDQEEKIYVQHRLYEHRASLWDWLQNGAFLYVCGDAEKMAKDVDATLHRIAAEEGNLSVEEARLYIKQLRAKRQYLLDVY